MNWMINYLLTPFIFVRFEWNNGQLILDKCMIRMTRILKQNTFYMKDELFGSTCMRGSYKDQE